MPEIKIGKDARKDLLEAFAFSLGKDSARTSECVFMYYGMNGKPAMTLEMIGAAMEPQLTRERIRQIIDAGVMAVKAMEEATKKSCRPFATAKEVFSSLMEDGGVEFVQMKDFLAHPYFKSMGSDMRGLTAFASDVGIKQVVYRGGQYLYPADADRKGVIKAVQSANKKERRGRTEAKSSGMSKTVTYVPAEIKDALKENADKRGCPLNRMYEEILTKFGRVPSKSPADFEKTRSWKARKGLSEWVQVGIYIEKEVFERARKESEKLGVSLMSYICRAFSWFAENPSKV